MEPKIMLLIALASTVAIIHACTASEAFAKNEIVPDVVDTSPMHSLEVSWPSGVTANLGNTLTPTEVKEQPTVSWNADSGVYYTLIMTDPDAPSRRDPKLREWQHWIVVNIPGSKVDEGEVLSEYVGSGPPQGTGLHRYAFVVFKQKSKQTFDEPHHTNKNAEGREKFSTKGFAKKYDLVGPLYGNFYQAEYDDYVPILYKQLGA